MTDINDIDLRLTDTTLLMVFLGLMRHRQATAVAREMGLTQPAVSHALKRLRSLYDDPLFLRRAHGLEPTSLARDLEPQVRRIVRLISETLSQPQDFDPAKTEITLRLGAFDYELATVLPELVGRLLRDSPNVKLHTYPHSNLEALDALVESRIDLAIGYFEFDAHREKLFVADKLCADRYVLAARVGHPILCDLERLGDLEMVSHLLISPSGPVTNLVDHALQLQGQRRQIKAIVPSLFAALSIVENSDLVVTLPERVARKNATRFAIGYVQLPMEGGSFDLHVVRHARDAQDPTLNWVIERLIELVE